MKKIVSVLLIVAVMATMFVAFAASTVKTSGSCNLRKGPGLDYDTIITVPKGATASYSGTSKKDGRGVTWYKVTYNSKTGWVSSKYAAVSGGSSSSSTETGKCNIRKGAGLSYAVLGTMPVGAKPTYSGTSKKDGRGVTWYKVTYKGVTGWVSSKYYKPDSGSSSSGTGNVTATGDCNIRKGPALSYAKVGTMPKGAKATYQGSTKTDSRGVKWYKVTYKGVTGWVSSKYTKNTASGKSAATGCNIRSGAGTSYSIVGLLPTGKTATYAGATQTVSGEKWYKVTYNGVTGWVCAKYASVSGLNGSTSISSSAPESIGSTSIETTVDDGGNPFVATDPNELTIYMLAPVQSAIDALSLEELSMGDGEYNAVYSNGDVSIARYDEDLIAGIMIYSNTYSFYGTKVGMTLDEVKLTLSAYTGMHIVEHDGHLDCGVEGDNAWNGSCASEIQYLFTDGVVSSIDWHAGTACISYE